MKPLAERGVKAGDTAELIWRAGPEHGIALGRTGQVTVFSTPSMINLMEHAAKKLLAPHLGEGEESVGAEVNVSHLAATPLGVEVRALAEVTAVGGKTVDFRVTAFDDQQRIGEGTHKRAVINVDTFAGKLRPSPEAPNVGCVAPWSDLVPDPGSMPAMANLRVQIEGKLAIVTNHRPQALNALDPATVADFGKLLPWLAGHANEVQVVILTGEGKSFCAGSDIRVVEAMSVEEASRFSLDQGTMGNRLAEIPQPVIAAINGYAFGGGMVLAGHCDFRLAAMQAQFSMPEIKLGWPGGWGMAPLHRALGHDRTVELCLTGKTINARTAEAWGFLHKVVPGTRLMAEARALANDLLEQPPLGLRENKWLMHYLAGPFARGAHVAANDHYIRCLRTADAREGIEAFLVKRKPRWQGR